MSVICYANGGDVVCPHCITDTEQEDENGFVPKPSRPAPRLAVPTTRRRSDA